MQPLEISGRAIPTAAEDFAEDLHTLKLFNWIELDKILWQTLMFAKWETLKTFGDFKTFLLIKPFNLPCKPTVALHFVDYNL